MPYFHKSALDILSLSDSITVLKDGNFTLSFSDRITIKDDLTQAQMQVPGDPGEIRVSTFGVEVSLAPVFTVGSGPGFKVSQFAVEVAERSNTDNPMRVTQFGIELAVVRNNSWQIQEIRET